MQNRPADYLGQSFEAAPDARILSLVPSLTELVFDLGLGASLVGRTHFCIHPADSIEAISSVGGTKKINMDRVRDIAPTHALVNVDENPKEMADTLRAMGVQVIVTHPMNPDDNVALYRLIGDTFCAPDAADRLIEKYNRACSMFSSDPGARERRVLYLIWKDPWMAISADTYIGNMLGLVNWRIVTPGADCGLEGDAARYPEVSVYDACLDAVDLVLFSSEPYAFNDADIRAFSDACPAHAHKAHLIDGEMTSWYGSRAIAGLDYIRTFAAAIRS